MKGYVKVIVVNKKNPFWFDTLIDKLYKVNAEDISVVENFDIEDFDTEDLIDEGGYNNYPLKICQFFRSRKQERT